MGQLKALLWKNFWIKKARPGNTCVEFILPLLWVTQLFLFLFMLSTLSTLSSDPYTRRIYYSPSNDQQLGVVGNASSVTGTLLDSLIFLNRSNIISFKDETSLEEYQKNSTGRLWGGVIFHQANTTERVLNYTLRIPKEKTPYLLSFGFFSFTINNWDSVLYLQQSFETAFTKLMAKRYFDSDVKLGDVPTSTFPKSFIATQIVALIMLVFLILSIAWFVLLISEKLERVKEALKIVGLSEIQYNLSWFLTFGVSMMLYCFILLIGLYALKFFTSSSFLLNFALIFCFGLSVISFTFLLVSLINSKDIGIIALIGFLYVPGIVGNQISTLNAWQVHLLSLVSPIAFIQGFNMATSYDTYDGLSFSNFTEGSYSFLHAVMWLLFDFVIYGMLAWYFQNVKPGPYGVGKSPLFFLKSSFWSSGSNNLSQELNRIEPHRYVDSSKFQTFESELNQRPSIIIRDLMKRYDDDEASEPAVKDLNLDVYQGQIFGFLGTNGAGKSTTIFIMSGVTSSTSGKVYINDIDVEKDIDGVRRSIGVCMQDNILFDHLSPLQNLQVFGMLRGMNMMEATHKAEGLLEAVNLSMKRNEAVNTLSGGMKRRVCIALSLIGDPKVVFLDEPTSGMDLVSRRQFWEIIKGMKVGRTIILTTHYMDEADYLSDRIGIMKDGSLMCCGNSTFLKDALNTGDQVRIVVDNRFSQVELEQLRTISSKLVKSSLLSDMDWQSRTCTLTLPPAERASYPSLLSLLEEDIRSKGNLRLKSFGITMASLEDVFIKVTRGKEEEEEENLVETFEASGESDRQPLLSRTEGNETDWKGKLKVLLTSRFFEVFTAWKSSIMFLLIPTLAMILALLIAKGNDMSQQTNDSNNPLYNGITHFDSKTWGRAEIPYVSNVTSSSFISTSSVLNPQISFKELKNRNDLFYYIQKDRSAYHRFASLQFTKDDIIIWKNSTDVTEAPIIFNLISNVNSMRFLNISSDRPIFSVYFHPFDGKTASDDLPSLSKGTSFTGVFNSIEFLVLGFGIMASMLAKKMIGERKKKVKLNLHFSGVDSFTYFFTQLLVDSSKIFLSILPLILVALAFKFDPLLGNVNLYLGIFLYSLFMSFCLMLFNYLLSYLFKEPDDCQKYLIGLNIIVVIVPFIIYAFSSKAPKVIATLTPLSSFAYAFYELWMTSNSLKAKSETATWNTYASDSVIQTCFISIVVCLVVFSAILSAIEFYLNKKPSKATSTGNFPFELDSDVKEERERAASSVENDRITVVDVVKEFSGFRAVDTVSFGLIPNECFGLVGPNGAGKTSLMSMLVREIDPNCGDIRIAGESVWNVNKQKHFKSSKIGYCPQFDSLHDNLTVEQHIRLYLSLRGKMSREEENFYVNLYLKKIGLESHTHKLAHQLSGGTKRKLCSLLALLPRNELILLDEPSTGIDATSRRKLWKAIEAERKKPNKSVLLTTHSMEEAEACSSRVGMMVHGQFQCIGAVQHLKGKFESQHFIFLNCLEEKADEVDQFVLQNFPNSKKLQGDKGISVQYDIGKVESVAQTFELMEKNKQKLGISNYTITQATLEQVFVHFAKEQEDEEDLPPGYWPSKSIPHFCKRCKMEVPTVITSKASSFTWLVAIVVFFLACFITPFVFTVPTTKDIIHRCSRCFTKLGESKVNASELKKRVLGRDMKVYKEYRGIDNNGRVLSQP
eukprot:TRINITY_DN1033_c1_g1_i5.p1 TRINITY_DN1033_c1_g1~~TRINITY_DN1033_c1_g1_i5.p1  ORF type:complete len:1679 (+),score=514.57 TRINITY_DN1033_c1_g1_i5:100-5136(+)